MPLRIEELPNQGWICGAVLPGIEHGSKCSAIAHLLAPVVQYSALMDDQSTALSLAIGARVKRERQGRKWTLDQLASASGVSRRMLVNIEKGSSNAGVGTLLRISDALGVGLPQLVEPPGAPSLTITRSGTGATLWRGEHGGTGVLVASAKPPDVVELWDWSLGPGDRHSSEPHVAGARELIQVTQGSIAVEVAGTSVTLDTGDALAFAADQEHAYANRTSVGARFSLAVYEPPARSRT